MFHAQSIAKLCAPDKQHFAADPSQDAAMANRTLNQVLAENLRAAMKSRGLSALQLGKKAGVSPRTVANYCAGQAEVQLNSSGKERSAKLVEVERIAAALGVSALSLLTDQDEQRRMIESIVQAVMMGTLPQGSADPDSAPNGKPRRNLA